MSPTCTSVHLEDFLCASRFRYLRLATSFSAASCTIMRRFRRFRLPPRESILGEEQIPILIAPTKKIRRIGSEKNREAEPRNEGVKAPQYRCQDVSQGTGRLQLDD